MAVPNADGHGTFSPVVSTRPTNKALRVLGAGAAVILACAAVVALVGVSTQGAPRSALVAVPPAAHGSLAALASYFLKHGETMTPKAALATIKQFDTRAPALMARLGKADTQMLADAFGSGKPPQRPRKRKEARGSRNAATPTRGRERTGAGWERKEQLIKTCRDVCSACVARGGTDGGRPAQNRKQTERRRRRR